MGLWLVQPLFWIFISSFKNNIDVFDYPPKIFFTPVLVAYSSALLSEWSGYFMNSAIVSTLSTFLAFVIGTPAAYALARFNIKGKQSIAFDVLSVRMIPPVVTLIPLFLMMVALNLINTHISLILVYTVFNLPYVVWIMRSFIEQIPKEAEEAAILDGCSTIQLLMKIVLPMCKPGIAVTATFCFIQAWNDFPLAFVLGGGNTKTVPVALASFISMRRVLWNQLFAIGVLNMIPAVILVYLIRGYWVRGLTLGMVRA